MKLAAAVALVGAGSAAAMELGLEDLSSQCRWDSGMGTSFDLSAMTKAANGYYQIPDMRNPNLIYFFNMCGASAGAGRDATYPPRRHRRGPYPRSRALSFPRSAQPTSSPPRRALASRRGMAHRRPSRWTSRATATP
jgi:hypothetical protein